MAIDSWPLSSLGEFVRLHKGVSYKGEFLDKPGPRLLGMGTVELGGGLKLEEARTYSGPINDSQRIRPGELFIAITGITPEGSVIGSPAFLPSYAKGEFAVTHHIARVELKSESKLDVRFLYYLLRGQAFQDYVRGVQTGSTVPTVSIDDVLAFKTSIPPIRVQRSISSVLGSLDEKIELNRQLIRTLTEVARSVFKFWFVEFGPVRAKAEGRWMKGQGIAGVPSETWECWPDSFEDSELGDIPKGWRAGAISDLALLNPESWSRGTRPDILRYVDLSNTKLGRIDAIATYPGGGAPSRAQRILRPGDTIVGTVRPGNQAYALVSEEGLTGSSGFAVLRPRRPEYREFVYLSATSPEIIRDLASLADGSAYPAVRADAVAESPVVLADDRILSSFSASTRPLLTKAASLDRQSNALAAVRDALLPRLLSGEIRIPLNGSR
ncbi:MAG: restriction endonuclease subunit S [Thermoplasmata archaeon]